MAAVDLLRESWSDGSLLSAQLPTVYRLICIQDIHICRVSSFYLETAHSHAAVITMSAARLSSDYIQVTLYF